MYHPSHDELYRWGLFWCGVILVIVGCLVFAVVMVWLRYV